MLTQGQNPARIFYGHVEANESKQILAWVSRGPCSPILRTPNLAIPLNVGNSHQLKRSRGLLIAWDPLDTPPPPPPICIVKKPLNYPTSTPKDF